MELNLSHMRRPSRRFGWVDRRLLTDGHLAPLGPVEISVYLMLCVVADCHGVSWYAPGTLAGLVKCPPNRVRRALESLADARLVALADRYVQVLDLDLLIPAPAVPTRLPATRSEPVTDAPPAMTARHRLEQLRSDVREELLGRARLVRLTGGREPSRSSLEAVAASLIDQEVA
jgi:hypothetical protein